MARNAPGRHHRVGLSLPEVMDEYPDDASAERWFTETRWPDGVRCPRCGGHDVLPVPSRRPLPWRCRGCTRYFSTKTGTVMHGSKVGYRKWLLAIYLVVTHLGGVSSMHLHRMLRVTQSTAWHLLHRVREGWGGRTDLFAGPAEADEAYFGGKRENMSNAKRRALAEAGMGRGPAGKEIVAGIRDQATGRVVAQHVPRADAATLREFVRAHVRPGAALYTDEAPAYRGMPEYAHEAVRHSVSEYVRGQVHTNGMESFWAQVKRGIVGVFRKVSPKHLDRYVTEFAGRQSTRPLDTADMMRAVALGMEGRRLRYRDLIADNGLPSGARPVAA